MRLRATFADTPPVGEVASRRQVGGGLANLRAAARSRYRGVSGFAPFRLPLVGTSPVGGVSGRRHNNP